MNIVSLFDDQFFAGNYLLFDNNFNSLDGLIVEFIEKKLIEYNIDKKNLIILGISKGGTIAVRIADYFKQSSTISIVPIKNTNNFCYYPYLNNVIQPLTSFDNFEGTFKFSDSSLLVETINDFYTFDISSYSYPVNYKRLLLESDHAISGINTIEIQKQFLHNYDLIYSRFKVLEVRSLGDFIKFEIEIPFTEIPFEDISYIYCDVEDQNANYYFSFAVNYFKTDTYTIATNDSNTRLKMNFLSDDVYYLFTVNIIVSSRKNVYKFAISENQMNYVFDNKIKEIRLLGEK